MQPRKLSSSERAIGVIDTQSGGDVSRIVTSGIAPLPGETVLQQLRFLMQNADGLRRLLLSEPYGDPAMSVDLIVPPSHPDAQAGYIIMEAMGYPLYSGSNTICTVTALLESGLIPMREGEQTVTLESPAGLAHIRAVVEADRVTAVTTRGQPAFVAATGLTTDVPGYGTVTFDLVWSGAYFAMLDATSLGFQLTREEEAELIACGHAFVEAARPGLLQEHPLLGNCGPLPFAHFMGPVTALQDGQFQSPTATYVHPGVICRSPTGTGTSARLALMADRDQIHEGQTLETISPRGNRFTGKVLDQAKVGHYAALNSEITGRSWRLSESRILVDLNDPLVEPDDLAPVLAV